MGNKQDSFDPQLHSHIDGLPHEVTAFDTFRKGKGHVLSQEGLAVVAGGDQQIGFPGCHLLPHFHPDALHQSSLAHRLHNP